MRARSSRWARLAASRPPRAGQGGARSTARRPPAACPAAAARQLAPAPLAQPPPPSRSLALQAGVEELHAFGRSALLAALKRSCKQELLLQEPLSKPLLRLLDLERRCCFQWCAPAAARSAAAHGCSPLRKAQGMPVISTRSRRLPLSSAAARRGQRPEPSHLPPAPRCQVPQQGDGCVLPAAGRGGGAAVAAGAGSWRRRGWMLP
jgi:hypothetical protein